MVMGGGAHLDEAFAFPRAPSYLVVIKSQAGIRLQRLQSSGEQGGGGKRHDPPGGLPGPFLSS